MESSQYATTMMMFMKYPDISDIHDVIKLAKDISDKKGDYDPQPYIKPLSGQMLTEKVSEMDRRIKKRRVPEKKVVERKAEGAPKAEEHVVEPQRVKEESVTDKLIKTRIWHSIQLLGSAITNEGVVSDPTCVVEALSELKLVNAVLNGMVSPDAADGYFNIFDKKE